MRNPANKVTNKN